MSLQNTSSFRGQKTQVDYSSDIAEYLQYGIVTVEYEEFEYDSSTKEYMLNADGVSGSTTVLAITSVQGMDDDGNWRPPAGSFNGINSYVDGSDYQLVVDEGSEAIIPDLGTTLYQRIEFLSASGTNSFEDGTKFYVSYRYYDSERGGSITNFNDGSIAKMFADSIGISLSNLNSELLRVYNSGYVTLATASDLDNHAEVWGLTRAVSGFAEGKIKIINDSSDTLISLNANTAIVSYIGNTSLIFYPTTGGTVPAGEFGWFDIIAGETGHNYNIGSYSITKVYENNGLSVELTTSEISISNPPTFSGSLNTFSGGAIDESDEILRIRILNAAKRSSRGTLESVKAALELTDIVDKAEIMAWQTNPALPTGTFYVMPISYDNNKLLNDTSSINIMTAIVNEYKPVSIAYGFIHPVPIMIQLSGVITIEDDDYDDADSIQTLVEEKITNYIQELTVGDDVIYSEIIHKAQTVGGVFDFTIDKFNYTEFATVPPAYDNTTYRISNNESGSVPGDTTFIDYYQEMVFVPKGIEEAFVYSGSDTFPMTYDNINTAYIVPAVYLAIQDEYDNWVRDPSYTVNWYTSNTASGVTIDESAGSAHSLTPISGDHTFLFTYEYNETDTIDGLRVKLNGLIPSGSTDPTVAIEIFSGVTPLVRLGSGTVTVVSGVANYEVLFASPLTVSDATDPYYLVVSGVSNCDSGVYITLPVSASGTRGLLGSDLYSGVLSGTWVRIPNTTMMSHTVIVTSGVASIPIEKQAFQPDVAVLYELDTTYQSKTTYDVLKAN